MMSDSIHNRSLLVSHTYTITPKLLNEFRFGFTNVTTSVNFPIQGSTALSQLDLTGVDISQHPFDPCLPHLQLQRRHPSRPIGSDKAGITQSKTTQFSDNLTYTFGKHTMKGGIDIRRVRYFDLESFAPEFASDDFGDLSSNPLSNAQRHLPGNAFGDFLEGAPTTLYFAVSSPDVGGTATQYSLFAQDEFQLNSRLTLSYGLRWQILPGFQEDGGNLANFDQRNNSIVVPDALGGISHKPEHHFLERCFSAVVQCLHSGTSAGSTVHGLPCTKYITASQDGLPQSLRNIYKGNFQPRLPLPIVRSTTPRPSCAPGFGIYTMTNLGPLSFNNSGNPTSSLHTYANSNAAGPNTPQIVFPNTAPAKSGGLTFGGGGLDQGVDPNFRDPQSNQWNVTVERELTNATSLRASYVGMHTYRLSITEDLNQIAPALTPYNTGATAGVLCRFPCAVSELDDALQHLQCGRGKLSRVRAPSDASHGAWALLRCQLYLR